jgi:hypothetical protein
MKKIIKALGNIPTLGWGLGVILGNVITVMFNNVPAILTFNAIALVVLLLGIFGRKIK